MSQANGLVKYHQARCAICRVWSEPVDGDLARAVSQLRAAGWRPERRRETFLRYPNIPDLCHIMGTKTHTDWYCPQHEQMRPSLRKNHGLARSEQV